jgi:hypothetical protein
LYICSNKFKTIKKMENSDLKKGMLINAGNFQVSIGTFDIRDVAIISKSNGKFVEMKNIRKGGKLAKVKNRFKSNLNSKETFTFQFMQPTTTIELINFLKKK